MATTVADQMSEILAAAGVERVYGIVGDILGILPLYRLHVSQLSKKFQPKPSCGSSSVAWLPPDRRRGNWQRC